MNENEELNAGEGAEDLELEKNPGDDPFDLIEDEQLRADAKKFRAIANRKVKVAVVEKPPVVVEKSPIKTDDFVKKSDLALMAVNGAKELVSNEVKEHWDDLMEIPLSGYDNLDAKSIANNMAERLVIFNARNPVGEKKEDVSYLTTTKTTGTGSGPSVDKTKTVKNPPNFNLPTKPDDWYKS